jgi:hypothetical protein
MGYQVSALHRLIYLDMSGLHERPIVRGESAVLDVLADAGVNTVVESPLRFRSPSVETILTWRQSLVDKYHEQLADGVTWDEASDFVASEDVSTSGDRRLYCMAAVLDQHGQAALNGIIGRPPPSRDELNAAYAGAARRGFGGRFPQLLLGARTWLPFEENLMIEEPDWDGQPGRYGSVFRLVDELTALRAAIVVADPEAALSVEPYPDPDTVAAAWQTLSQMLRLAELATARHLPMRRVE